PPERKGTCTCYVSPKASSPADWRMQTVIPSRLEDANRHPQPTEGRRRGSVPSLDRDMSCGISLFLSILRKKGAPHVPQTPASDPYRSRRLQNLSRRPQRRLRNQSRRIRRG